MTFGFRIPRPPAAAEQAVVYFEPEPNSCGSIFAASAIARIFERYIPADIHAAVGRDGDVS